MADSAAGGSATLEAAVAVVNISAPAPVPVPAFPGAKHDAKGYCLRHPKVRLCRPVFGGDDVGRDSDGGGNVRYRTVRKICPQCGVLHHQQAGKGLRKPALHRQGSGEKEKEPSPVCRKNSREKEHSPVCRKNSRKKEHSPVCRKNSREKELSASKGTNNKNMKDDPIRGKNRHDGHTSRNESNGKITKVKPLRRKCSHEKEASANGCTDQNYPTKRHNQIAENTKVRGKSKDRDKGRDSGRRYDKDPNAFNDRETSEDNNKAKTADTRDLQNCKDPKEKKEGGNDQHRPSHGGRSKQNAVGKEYEKKIGHRKSSCPKDRGASESGKESYAAKKGQRSQSRSKPNQRRERRPSEEGEGHHPKQHTDVITPTRGRNGSDPKAVEEAGATHHGLSSRNRLKLHPTTLEHKEDARGHGIKRHIDNHGADEKPLSPSSSVPNDASNHTREVNKPSISAPHNEEKKKKDVLRKDHTFSEEEKLMGSRKASGSAKISCGPGESNMSCQGGSGTRNKGGKKESEIKDKNARMKSQHDSDESKEDVLGMTREDDGIRRAPINGKGQLKTSRTSRGIKRVESDSHCNVEGESPINCNGQESKGTSFGVNRGKDTSSKGMCMEVEQSRVGNSAINDAKHRGVKSKEGGVRLREDRNSNVMNQKQHPREGRERSRRSRSVDVRTGGRGSNRASGDIVEEIRSRSRSTPHGRQHRKRVPAEYHVRGEAGRGTTLSTYREIFLEEMAQMSIVFPKGRDLMPPPSKT